MSHLWKVPLESKIAMEHAPCLIGDTPSNGCFSILSCLVFWGVSSHCWWLGILGPGFCIVSQRLLDEWSFPKFQFEFFTPEVPFFCFPKPQIGLRKDIVPKGYKAGLRGTPRSSICSEGFPLFSPSILGYHYFWKHPYLSHFFPHFGKRNAASHFLYILSSTILMS